MDFSWNSNKSKQEYSWQTQGLGETKLQRVAKEKQDLVSKGLPVSTREDRTTPTMGGTILRAPLKLVADVGTNIINAGQVISGKKETKPFSGGYLGKVEGLGKLDMTKGFTKENVKTLKKSVSTGAEIASYLSGGSVAKGATGLLKQNIKEFVMSGAAKKLAKEGAVTSLAGSLGYQGRQNADKGTPFSATQTIRDVALGTATAPIAGFGISKLFGKSASKVDDIATGKKIVYSGEPVTKETVNGTKFYTPNKETASKYADINKNVTGKSQVIEKDITGLNLKKVTQAEMQDAVENPDIMKNYDGIEFQVAGEKEPSYAIFDKPKVEQVIPTQTKVETLNNTNQSKTPIPEQIIQKDIQKMSDNIEGFDEGTFKQWSNDVRNLDIEEIMKVAMGGEKTIQNTIPKNAYLSVAKNIAEETRDIKLAQELAKSNVSSKGGQELVASKLAVGDNIVDDLVDIRKSLLKRKGLNTDKISIEENALLLKLKSKIKEITNTLPTKQEFDDIINNLVCK